MIYELNFYVSLKFVHYTKYYYYYLADVSEIEYTMPRLRQKCLNVCCLMPDTSCNAVNVIQWSSSSVWARQSQGNHIRYYLILGAKTVTSKTCSATNGRYVSRDLCFVFCSCQFIFCTHMYGPYPIIYQLKVGNKLKIKSRLL